MKDVIKEDKKYKLNRPITGNISEDRIWEQWYDPKIFQMELPKMNQRDYLFECNKGYEQQTILNNRGVKQISVNQLEQMVDLYARSLKAMEIGEGDVVASISLSTPELVALKYACATIGAITANLNYLDAKSGSLDHNKLNKQLQRIKPSALFTLDLLENQVSPVINDPLFRDMKKIRMSLAKSTPIWNREMLSERVKIAALRKMNTIKHLEIHNSISFSEFEKYALQYQKPIHSVYHEKMPCNIAFTSGTTGDSKAALLSHDANNALAIQQKFANLGLERGDKNLALVPPFLAFWDADIIHMAMCLGIENILELALTYENVPKYLIKHLPHYGIWSQYLWDSMLNMPKDQMQLVASHLKKVVVGGERAEVNQVNTFEKMTGLIQDAGYGATEMNSCFSVAHPNCNVIGSAGLPLPFNNVRVVDESGHDLTYNQRGRLLVTGPAQMNGYYGRDDLTNQVFERDSKGVIWYHTGDYGFVHPTGSLVSLDRDRKPIEINTNTGIKKLKLLDVNEQIKKSPYVKLCKTTSYEGKIVTHMVLDEFSDKPKEEALKSVLTTIENEVEKDNQPHIINLESSLPRTPLGKVDYPELENSTRKIVSIYQDAIGKSKLNILEGNKIYQKHI